MKHKNLTGNVDVWINYTLSWELKRSLRAILSDMLDGLLDLYRALVSVQDSPHSANFNGNNTLLKLIAEFIRFSLDYYLYFESQLVDRHKNYKELAPEDLQANMALKEVLAKIEREIQLLEASIFQRMPNMLQANDVSNVSNKKTIHRIQSIKAGDAAVSDLLRRVRLQTLLDKTSQEPQFVNGVVTFGASHHIRIHKWSYRPSPIISMPTIHADAPWHWLAIGHEVSHYLYNNAFQTNQSLFNVIPANDPNPNTLQECLLAGLKELPFSEEAMTLWQEWMEELFADVFGVILLGPAYVYSLILLLAPEISNESLLANDHVHPASLIRPLIQFEALKQLAQLDSEINDENPYLQELESLFGIETFTLSDAGTLWQNLVIHYGEMEGAETPNAQWQQWLEKPLAGSQEHTIGDYYDMSKQVVTMIFKQLFPNNYREDEMIPEAMDLGSQGAAVEYYRLANHKQILQTARDLLRDSLDPTIVEKDYSGRLSFSFLLVAVWYAWRELTQNWTVVGPLDATLDKLHDPETRGKSLGYLNNWLAKHLPDKDNSTEVDHNTTEVDHNTTHNTLEILAEHQPDKDNSTKVDHNTTEVDHNTTHNTLEILVDNVRQNKPSDQWGTERIHQSKVDVHFSRSFVRLINLYAPDNPQELLKFLLDHELSVRGDWTSPPCQKKIDKATADLASKLARKEADLNDCLNKLEEK